MKPSRFFFLTLYVLGALALLLALDRGLDIGLPIFVRESFWVLLLILGLVSLLDLKLSKRLPMAQVERIVPDRFFVGRGHQIGLNIRHQRGKAWLITLHDHYPNTWSAKNLPLSVKLEPGKVATLFYEITPPIRGAAVFSKIEQAYFSPLGLWQISKITPVENSVKVMPDFAQVLGADITGLEKWMNLLGAKRVQRRGMGMDFHQLREYRSGDTIKQIDWKATARKHALVSREYQDEKDQQIIFLLDCSRNMRSVDGELSHFDHALNAMLLLTYTALRHDDAVGVVTFSNEIPRYIAPAKGVAQLGRIIQGVYDVQPTRQTADYNQGTDVFMAKQKRRALVIVLTNLANEGEMELLSNLKRISRRHRLLIASLEEQVLEQTRKKNIETVDDALEYVGAVSYQKDQDELFQVLRAHKIPFLHTYPHKLGPELISQYLKMKQDGLW